MTRTLIHVDHAEKGDSTNFNIFDLYVDVSSLQSQIDSLRDRVNNLTVELKEHLKDQRDFYRNILNQLSKGGK